MQQFLALTSPGIEILLAQELKDLKASQVVQKPEGVYFTATIEEAYKICLYCRLSTRILLKLAEGDAMNKDQLFATATTVNWSEQFSSNHTFAIDFVGSSDEIRNTQFGALTIKDALVDHFRDQGMDRPSVDKSAPDISFQARLLRDNVVIYLDFSGRSLFKRGYREHSGAAPLKEHLAAAIITRSGWLDDTSKPLVDPMCGSGTILIEAIMMAADYAPGIDRVKWGFDCWLGHQLYPWQAQLTQAKQKSHLGLEQLKAKVFGIDIDSRVINTAQVNARNAGVQKFIEFSCKDINALNNGFGHNGTFLLNPPYGERIGELPELVENFVLLGRKLKAQFVDWRIAILTANVELLSMMKLASHKRYKFKNGPLDCQLALYNVDEKQASGQSNDAEFEDKDSDFGNRLLKNKKNLKSWLKKEHIECYRLYDADIPEYNVAVDVYGDYLVIQEYSAPKIIEESKVAKRLQEVIYFAPKVLGVPTDKVILKTRAKQKGSDQYQRVDQSKQSMIITEHGAKLKINLWDYLDTGLFLDHRKTRQIVAQKSKNKTLLNLFAYTGSVSLQAALHGAATVTTVDMSNTYLNWAQENFALNKLSGHKYQFIQADCLTWLKEHRSTYDVVFVDPPTFSNSKRMEDSFDVQSDHVSLITDAMKCVAENGELIFTNNKRNFKMDFDAVAALNFEVKSISELTRDKDFQRNKHIHNSWLITRKKVNK
ncbi:MAG: bifunctional 23S rRNA (guanine(2069)-N(7))-methyltransferase RlmK/23S rRNA (guanine(2445)-N(2))-methyltransferase RlmL [Colwellia sp.]|jgi:23S rRNA (guanine2445-N2)-methyltransferase / 23S rRNA (guanine2069-N7)-methyltransferase|uniref:bifunctional 23S rRNA (guanine(2069)-N(7))-methyltransferase RlmK/23S rRNA (guanine(2445)-N(2))-methyltransferase RlmL n=1 Tax=Colwellia sp. Bg11-12 TaxID=2759817 RepID=UPI0015F3AD35|nr:bifunctional 23S rRNA (guanine(2069)-N(7))-methyltransferase RlmK/23S rRNA (guanine(2445)-N(2))-methyltransferase RlmL [Colwellia sp. Bg11-12]MBA6264573.1 bifunctional 23S rRNA (guanine(2069)-N(7))-methyltransferase RlmK/23S rRNA (guanine(2445)-N(2))-methyltransferase RlmL [Colwellia sp. Bg11-12]